MHKRAPFFCLLGCLLSAELTLAQQSASPPPAKSEAPAPASAAKDPLEVWQPVTVKEGNFAVIFPVNSKREGVRSRIQMQDGNGIETRFTAPTPDGNYQAAFTFLSDNIATPQAVRQRFEVLLKNLKSNPKIKWLGGGEIEYRGNPGIELKVQMGENKIITWSRQYFAFGCIYELTARYSFREPELKEPQIFLDSFNLLGPPTQRPTLAPPKQDMLPDFTPLSPTLYYVTPETLRARAVEKPEPKLDTDGKAYNGTLTVLVTVSTAGKVVGAEIADGFPGFYEPAIKALKKWRFTPFQVNGRVVDVQGRLTFKFGGSQTPK
jgi:TonB family protein